MNIDINVNELICDNFVDIVDDIVNCKVDKAVLKGGRSSTKSQVASESILMGCMVYKESAIACIKYANKIQDRLVNTFTDSINYLGVNKWWKLRKAPLEYVLLDDLGRETDVSIKFTGCDNPETLRSMRSRRGGFRYIWLEEVFNFPTEKEVNDLLQTLARGEGDKCIIYTYNPPMSSSSWLNKKYNVITDRVIKKDKNVVYSEYDFEVEPGVVETNIQVVHHSTYLDVIASGHYSWLGSIFVGEAKKAEKENPRYYEWAYLGHVVPTEASVFTNVHEWDGDISELNITEVNRGYDWGYGGPDTNAYVHWYFDKKNKYLYCLDEFGKPKMSVDDIAFEIKKRNKHNFPVYADSANPLLNNELSQKGVNVVPVDKGGSTGSIRAGIKWLQGMNGIFISPDLTPKTYKEFTEYEYVLDKNDEVTTKLPDKNNHFIDSTRYAYYIDILYVDN